MVIVHARISYEETSIFDVLQATSTLNIEAEIVGLGSCRAFSPKLSQAASPVGVMHRSVLLAALIVPVRSMVGRGARGSAPGRGYSGRSGAYASRGGSRGSGGNSFGNVSRRPPPQSWADDDESGADPWDDDDVDLAEPRDAIYGVNPVFAALQSHRRTFHRLLLQDTLSTEKRTDRPALLEIERLAADAGVPVERLDKGSLNGMCRNRPHQGLVLQASPLEFEPMQALPLVAKGEAPLWLALDEVTDPQNFGALLRSAFFLGAAGVLVSQKNSCPLTPVVSKSSAGAMELMRVHAARNLVRALEGAREDGWQVVGAALQESVEPEALDASQPTVLVLGSEGHGLRTNVLRACSAMVRIPRGESSTMAYARAYESMNGAQQQQQRQRQADVVDSLNVSVAGGILLHSLLGARKRLGKSA